MVHIHQTLKGPALRCYAHCDKHALYIQFSFLSIFYIGQGKTLYHSIPIDTVGHCVPYYLHIIQGQQILLQALGCPQFISPVNQIHLAAHTRQENGILHSHIAASDDSRDLIAEKCPVAGGTVGHSGSCQLFLARHAQLPVHSSGGKYKRPGLIGISLAHHALDCAFSSILDIQNLVLHEPGSQTVCVFPEFNPQVVSADSGKSGIVVHLIGGQDLASADHCLFYHKSVQLCPLGINSSRQTCRSGADNNQIINMRHSFTFSFYSIQADIFTILFQSAPGNETEYDCLFPAMHPSACWGGGILASFVKQFVIIISQINYLLQFNFLQFYHWYGKICYNP